MSAQNGSAPGGRGGTPDPIDFLAVLNDPNLCATLPLSAVAPLLVQVAAGLTRLTALQNALAARILAGSVTLPPSHSAESLSEQGALTQEAAAEAYCIPLRTLRRLTRTKSVPSYLLGRNRMIRPADLNCYLARCREQGVRVGTRLT